VGDQHWREPSLSQQDKLEKDWQKGRVFTSAGTENQPSGASGATDQIKRRGEKVNTGKSAGSSRSG
jgi:hypothetical protein